MPIVRYRVKENEAPALGLLDGDRVTPLVAGSRVGTMRDLLQLAASDLEREIRESVTGEVARPR